MVTRIPAAIPKADRHGRRRHREGEPRSVRAGRHQRHLSKRAVSAVWWIWQGRPEPGTSVPTDEQLLEHHALPSAPGDTHEEPHPWLPDAVHGAAAVAAPRGDMESDGPSEVHPAGRLCQ